AGRVTCVGRVDWAVFSLRLKTVNATAKSGRLRFPAGMHTENFKPDLSQTYACISVPSFHMAQGPRMNPNDPQPDSSPAQAYLDGLMEAVGARVQMQRSRSGVVPPPATGDPIVDAQNTVRWSRTSMQQKRQELEQAQQQFARIKQQFQTQQSPLPPQIRKLFESLITMERTVMQQWLEDRVQPPESPFDQRSAAGSTAPMDSDPDSTEAPCPKLKIHA
ncbi:MAG: hypothetical protein ABGZ17_09155, partial [Planctomycetaceae bacterium]